MTILFLNGTNGKTGLWNYQREELSRQQSLLKNYQVSFVSLCCRFLELQEWAIIEDFGRVPEREQHAPIIHGIFIFSRDNLVEQSSWLTFLLFSPIFIPPPPLSLFRCVCVCVIHHFYFYEPLSRFSSVSVFFRCLSLRYTILLLLTNHGVLCRWSKWLGSS